MSKLVFEYVFDGCLPDALLLADEVEQNLGLTPAFIVTTNERLKYNEDDAIQLRAGHITEDEYIVRNNVL
jgi:hypothetical protein